MMLLMFNFNALRSYNVRDYFTSNLEGGVEY